MRDALATLVEVARRAARLPGGLVVRTTLLGALCSLTVCMLGIGVALSAAVIAEGHAKLRRGGESARTREIGPASLLVVSWIVGWFGSIAAVELSAEPALRVLAVLGASAGLGVLLAPLRLAAGAGDGAYGDALVRVLAAMGQRPARLLAVGAVDGVGAWGIAAVLFVASSSHGAGVAMLDTVVLLLLGTCVSFVWPLAAYDVCVRDQAPLLALRAPRLRNVLLVLAPGLVLASIATMVELARPLGAWHPDDGRSEAPVVASREIGFDFPSAPLELGTPSGLGVRATGLSTLDVSTADGGGCGAIVLTQRTPHLHPVSFQGHLEARRTTFRGRAAFVLGPWRAAGGEPVAVAFVDDEGVRLDDTLGDRLAVRLDRVALGLLSLAALLVLALVIATLRSARTAAALVATPLGSARESAWVVLCGKVRRDGGRVRIDARGVHVEGDVSFEGGGRVIAVAPGTYAAGRLDSSTDDGAEAFVVAPARALKSEGYRLAPRAEAELFGLGTIDDARARFLARDAQRLVWLAVPACVALLAYAAWVALPP